MKNKSFTQTCLRGAVMQGCKGSKDAKKSLSAKTLFSLILCSEFFLIKH